MTLKRVIISGGTHGNEFTGAYLAKHWQKNPEQFKSLSFDTDFILTNEKAHKLARRYVDQDLNRSFNPENLQRKDDCYEVARAQALSEQYHSADVILDLHTTTANMGLSLVLTKMDALSLEMAAYLCHHNPLVNCYAWIREDVNEGFFVDTAKHGFAIEVGPIPQAVLNAEIYLQTKSLVLLALDFLQQKNEGKNPAQNLPLTIYEHQEMVDYPRDNNGDISAMIHPELQNKDFQLLKNGEPIFMTLDGNTITWQGNEVYPVFINEAAYYEKGIAFSTTKPKQHK